MRKKLRQIITVILTLTLIISALSVSALSADNERKVTETADYLSRNFSAQVGSIGGEWSVIGLARCGKLSEEQKQSYYKAVESYVSSVGSNRLHKRKSSDNSRVVLALSAIGKNAADINGFNLIQPLSDFEYVKKQGINGVIWALIALDSCGYYLSDDIRDTLISEILSKQHNDGGWGLDDTSDPDVTGMAVQSLAPYRAYDNDIQTAVGNAVIWMTSLKTENLSPETCAQLIAAATAQGINPEDDERFSDIIDCLMRYSTANGFSHTINGEYNQMATEQAFYALVSCERLSNGQTSLYDMTDISNFEVLDFDNDGKESINDVTIIQRYIAEFGVEFTTPQKRRADLNKNGRIDISDVTKYQQRLAR